MKKNKIWLVLSVICFGMSVAFAGDQMEEEYPVKINDIQLQRGSAGNLLRYVNEYGGKFFDASGNEVTEIKRNLELTSKDPLVIEMAKVYRNCCDNRDMPGLEKIRETDHSSCYVYSPGVQKLPRKVNICIDKNTEVAYTLIVLR